MRQRKNIGCAIIFALLWSSILTGCGALSQQGEASQRDDMQQEETAQQQDDASQQGGTTQQDGTAQQDDTQHDGASSTITGVKVTGETEYRNWYSEDGEQWLMQGECDSIQISGDGYEVLCAAVNQWDAEQTENFWNYCEDLAEDAADSITDVEVDAYSYYYNSLREVEITRVDESVLSILILNYDYVGGVHGEYGYSTITFDVESGEILTLDDILDDKAGFLDAAQSYIVEKLAEDYGEELFDGYEDSVQAMWDGEPVWYLDAEGITFIFNPYELGPYSMGEASVTCPYAEVGGYLKEKYAGMKGTGAGKFSVNTEIETTYGTVSVNMEAEEDYGMFPVSVSFNETSVAAGEFGRFGNAYLLNCADGRSFVLFDVDYMSDDYVTFLYEITDGTVTLQSRLEDISLQKGTVSAEGMTLYAHLDVLGTWYAYMDYVIGEDGKLAQTRDVFAILQDGYSWRILTLVKELPVTIDGQQTVLSSGSRIRITGTDNDSTVYFTEEDSGETGTISYQRGDGEDAWLLFIDGVSEYEYFEMLPYVG